MKLRLIAGCSGTGKTRTCMEEIVQQQREGKGKQIYIVPEQFSSQAERDLAAYTQGKGLLSAEVLSFGRLAYRFIQKGKIQKVILDDTGKSMIIRKILSEIKTDLKYFTQNIDKQGFIQQLGLTVTELFQYHISIEQLDELKERNKLSKTMQDKLHDISLIYKKYNEFLKQEYISGDMLLDFLSQELQQSKNMDTTEVWIDGFYGFTPQELQVIRQLMRIAHRVTVTLTIDEYTMQHESIHQTAPFFETAQTKKKMYALAEEVGCLIENPLFLYENKRLQTEGLRYLEQNFFCYHAEGCVHNRGINIVTAPNRFVEMEYVAQQVIKIVRGKKYRFREIAVVTNALSEYEKSLKSIFREYEIPFFLDAKREIVSHPLMELVLSAVDNILYHFQYESMFRYLKTGLTSLIQEEVDILENYVLAYGIKGYKWELSQWNVGFLGDGDSRQAEMNQLRQKAIEPLLKFGKELDRQKKYSINFLVERVFQLVENLEVSNKLEKWAEEQQNINPEKSAQHQQIWSIFVELLNQMSQLLGQEEVSINDFGKILEAGLTKGNMGIIPTTTDCVLIGDIERSRLPEIKVLFLLGVNEGILPSPALAQGVFTDMEREVLEQSGVELAAGGKRRAFEEQFLIYRGITKPSHFVSLSYCTGDLEGKLWRPSSLIQRIHMLFPTLSELSADKQCTDIGNAVTQQACFHKLGLKMRQYAETGEMESVWKDIFSFFDVHPQWQKRVEMLREGISKDASEEVLSLKIRKKLYGKELHTSVSRLERFAACPYAYFSEYGLQAKERKEFSLQTPDLGILFHDVLEKFFSKISVDKISWDDLTLEKIEEYTNEFVLDVVASIGNGILMDTAANRYLIERLKRISNRTIGTLIEHISMGDFLPYDYEIGFGEKEKLPPIVLKLNNGEKLILRGKIDRVDILDQSENRFVKIIDYKSGEKEVSFRDIYYGLQLQLFVYLDAFLQNNDFTVKHRMKPGGVFYFHIKDPMITVDKEMKPEEIRDILFREMRMNGLVLDNPDVIHGMDRQFQVSQEGELSSGSSAIIPISINKDGTYKKGGADIANEEQYDVLLNFAKKQAKQLGERIMLGEIAPRPYRKENKTPCTYCIYDSICTFEPMENTGGYRDLKKISKEMFWEKVEKDND